METADLEDQLSRYAEWLERQLDPVEHHDDSDERRAGRSGTRLMVAAACVVLIVGIVMLSGRTGSAPASPTPTLVLPASTLPALQTTTTFVVVESPTVTVPEGAISVANELGPGDVGAAFVGTDMRLRISFTGATPYDPTIPCSRTYVPDVALTDTTVELLISALSPPPAEAAFDDCAPFTTPVVLFVDLDEPLGARSLTFQGAPMAVGTADLYVTTTSPANATTSASVNPDGQTYTAMPGDSVAAIAALYGISAETLANYNLWPEGLRRSLAAGELVKIPPGSAIPDGRASMPIEHLFIGDSVTLGAATVPTDRGYTVDAHVSRQMIEMVPVMEQLGERGVFGNLVVIHLGNNGPFEKETLAAFLAPLSSVPNVIILNLYADRSWTAGNNQLLEERDEPGDNLILIDWATLAAECPGECFAADGIHLDAAGMEYYADVIGDVTGL